MLSCKHASIHKSKSQATSYFDFIQFNDGDKAMQPVSQPVNPGSSSQKPDLDWSQAKETITMLCLATAQIEAALRDSTNSVDALAQSFTKIANDSQQVLKIASLMEVEESNRAHHSELTKSAMVVKWGSLSHDSALNITLVRQASAIRRLLFSPL